MKRQMTVFMFLFDDWIWMCISTRHDSSLMNRYALQIYNCTRHDSSLIAREPDWRCDEAGLQVAVFVPLPHRMDMRHMPMQQCYVRAYELRTCELLRGRQPGFFPILFYVYTSVVTSASWPTKSRTYNTKLTRLKVRWFRCLNLRRQIYMTRHFTL